jgi:hypothetical protein
MSGTLIWILSAMGVPFSRLYSNSDKRASSRSSYKLQAASFKLAVLACSLWLEA